MTPENFIRYCNLPPVHRCDSIAVACNALRQNPVDERSFTVCPPVEMQANGLVDSTSARGLTAALPVPPEATIILGVAGFFVARASSELQLFIQDALGNAICPVRANGHGPLRAVMDAQMTLLPNTCRTFRPDGIANAQPEQLLSLPASFRLDLDALPVTIPVFLSHEIDSAHGLPPDDAKAAHLALCMMAMFGVVGPGLGHGPADLPFSHLADLLATPAAPALESVQLHAACDEALTSDQRSEVASALRAVAVGIQSAAGSAADGTFDTNEAVLATISAGHDVILRDGPPGDGNTTQHIGVWLAAHKGELTRLGAAIADLRRNGNGNAQAAEFLDAAASVLGDIADLQAVTDALPTDAVQRTVVLHDFQTVLDAAANLLKKDYIAGALEILNLNAVTLVLDHMPDGAAKTLLQNIRTWGSLVATIARARTSDDVVAALNAAAAPVGSYRQMRRPRISVALAGQLGLMGGGESATGDLGPNSRSNTGGVLGIALPIGLEVGGGIGNGRSFQVLVSAIDLGNIATARFDGSSPQAQSSMTTTSGPRGVSAAPTIDLPSVLAPGLFFGFGIPRTPLVLGPMVEFAPFLRRYIVCSTNNCDTTSGLTFRYGIALTVDIPVFPLN